MAHSPFDFLGCKEWEQRGTWRLKGGGGAGERRRRAAGEWAKRAPERVGISLEATTPLEKHQGGGGSDGGGTGVEVCDGTGGGVARRGR